ncbi:putative copper resistance protein D [Neomicrococcus aestuarii]|uniref:Putative copper resistance protein D n=1 Tax=Neomicrococcus aestuarii TaxID=556325 RepID=A0A7W8TXE7_9MICC|nr:cytochrome c oxidase assembly protein [Neomicrococcus aestuarii]MBB5513256.1 putative copper resistance protein D [Neomicrococcus aestuarii]
MPRKTWMVAIAAVVAGIIATIIALVASGGSVPSTLGDPGAVTRWGLPIATGLNHAAMALTIGALAFAAAIVPRSTKPIRARASAQVLSKTGKATGKLSGTQASNSEAGTDDRTENRTEEIPAKSTDGGSVHPAFEATLTVAAYAGIVWTVAAAATLVLMFSSVSGLPLSGDSAFTAALTDYVLNISLGQAWAWMVLIAAVVTSLAFAVRSPAMLAITAVLGTAGILPLALTGHTQGGDDHWGAVNALGLHLLGVYLWAGGIGTLAFIAKTLETGAPGRFTSIGSRKTAMEKGAQPRPLAAGVVLKRFSDLAFVCILVVSASGIISAAIRMEKPADLLTPYGALVITKAVLTIALGVLGLMHRIRVIDKLNTGQSSALKAAWRLVFAEVMLMAAVIGVAAVLGRTATPIPEELPDAATPARILTGYDLPPDLGFDEWFTVWRWDWLWVAVVIFLGVAYARWMRTLAQRGDRWNLWRAISWYVGLIALTYVTSGPPAVYGMVLFSMHMVGHMALTMVVPLFLVIGAPMTLALRAMSPRQDGTRGPREWMLAFIHSTYSKVITHPIFAAVNFAGSIIIFYNTELFGFALREHVGHELMTVHFLLTGYIFALNMIGIDPLPLRLPHPFRLVLLLGTMVFHAFFAVSLMNNNTLIEADWFGSMGRTWGDPPMQDQELGAGAMWGIGEVPTLILALGAALAWLRSDTKTAKREDRRADANHDADLDAYNKMFEQLAEQDNPIDQRRGR